MAISQEQREDIISLYEQGITKTQIAQDVGVNRKSVARIINEHLADAEIVDQNIKLAKQKQRLQDTQRIERKSFREFARADVMISELHQKLLSRLEVMKFSDIESEWPVASHSKAVGVIQLSDLHFGELVYDLESNRYDFEVAAKRLEKLATRAINHFFAEGINSVAVFMTGDLVNSNRRISEITEYAAARTDVVLIAVDIIQQFLKRLLQSGFKVTVATVAGNESRVGDFFDTTNFLACDNYDVQIHNILSRLFVDVAEVNFLAIDNPIEKVVEVNGQNFLLVHGNVHKGVAATKQIENEVEKLKARFASRGVKIDYVICGHIHQSYLSNFYSRSASLVGGNQYSERSLNLVSKAAQNLYVVRQNGDIDAIMIDLQSTLGFEGFEFDKSMVRYFPSKEQQSTVTIQSVLI